jgi:threonylcarbamoyladenosine tRNA methylthiotransferase MtaB
MARRCTTASFRQLVQDARQNIPDLIVTTDIIVGFPGETDEDFEEGLRFVEEMRFAHAHIFPFSARHGTTAARFDGQVSKAVKKERARRMHDVVERTGRVERQRFLGSIRPVLWEGQGQTVLDQPGRLWTGFTDNYLRGMAVAPTELNLHNRITLTRLDDLQGDILFGTVLTDS